MPRYERKREPKRNTSDTLPDTRRLLAAALDEWQLVRNSVLPTPLPPDSLAAASWWLDTQQEPERPGETRRVPTGDSTRLELGYFTRTRQALLNFVRLTPEQRQTVIAGIADGIPYRGDDFETYLRIWQETEILRDIGRDEYAKRGFANMRTLINRMAAHG